MDRKKVIVVGAGLGGISAAISLAAEGFEVEVFEKNDKIGGKLNVMEIDGFQFDLGPSLFILPHLYRRLFERAGRVMEDYVTLEELHPQWRSFFEDGAIIDLHSDMALMEREIQRLGRSAEGYWDFVAHSRKLFKFAEEAYLERGADTLGEVLAGYSLTEVADRTDLFRTMYQGVARFIRHRNLRDMLAFFIKYVGSSPYDAPGMMNLLPYSQLGYGLWYVKGGMYNFARGCSRLLDELGVKVHLNTEVVELSRSGALLDGVVLQDGRRESADIIVSNMEVIPAYQRLLKETGLWLKRYEVMYEPAASGLVVHLGIDRDYPQLRHHNFLFSADPKTFLHSIHRRKELPEDPNVYMVYPTATDPTVAPAGHHIVKLLPHIPYQQNPPFTPADYQRLKERLLDKCERLGMENLRKHIVVEHVWTPDDIERMYYSNKGAIYGVVSNWKRNFALKAPKKSTRYDNLYFVGGSVNPGGGTPMVLWSGQLVCDRIVQDWLRP